MPIKSLEFEKPNKCQTMSVKNNTFSSNNDNNNNNRGIPVDCEEKKHQTENEFYHTTPS